MIKKISQKDKIFIAGSTGMAGKAIKKVLLENGYGLKENGGELLIPTRKELDLSDQILVNEWFEKNKPDVVILVTSQLTDVNLGRRVAFEYTVCLNVRTMPVHESRGGVSFHWRERSNSFAKSEGQTAKQRHSHFGE